mmetsp:Transcript_1188/g.1198  ORF Transcript_1188/g.1198 Transcript_1188/m.1198 type:complete len:125 (+) Transcript_1188:2078-2452(+)
MILGLTNASKSFHEMSVIKEEGGGDKMSKVSGGGSLRSQRSVITNNPEPMVNIGGSKVVKGLKNAIDMAGKLNQKNFSESYLNKIMQDVAQSYDIRATIFGTFYRVGFDLHELSAEEKQRMEII